MTLPMNLTIMVHPSDPESNLTVPNEDLPDTVIRLAMKLLRLQKENSPFCVYTKSLPSQMIHPSIVFQHIRDKDVYQKELLRIVENYEETVMFLRELQPDVSEDDLRWVLSVIQSRAFGNGMGQELLVPYVDIMNHGDLRTNELFAEHSKANVTYGWWRPQENKNGPEDWRMVVKARKTILEGEELFVSYGDHSNEFFLLFYGFVPFCNPRDEFVLFQNLDDVLQWFFETWPDARGDITNDQLDQLKRKIRIEGKMSHVVKLNVCADGSLSPILEHFFELLGKRCNLQAKDLMTRACLDHLSDPNIKKLLGDFVSLRDSSPEEDTFFK